MILKPVRHGVLAARLLYEHEGFSRWLFKKRGEMLSDWYTEIFMGERNYPEGLYGYLCSFMKILRDKKRNR
jgi:hypothetical protein